MEFYVCGLPYSSCPKQPVQAPASRYGWRETDEVPEAAPRNHDAIFLKFIIDKRVMLV
jgi:hypothetical protein